jgi:uncharacterized protein YndB with AHSA1/START domain
MNKSTSSAVSNERILSASPSAVFASFENPELLAKWWGPKGFTSTFQVFEFKPEGEWVFVMHGPNGANFQNENIFREIVRASKIVIEHVLNPWFKLTVALASHCKGDQTQLTWVQEFESPEFAAKMRPMCEPANEQVLDRLEAVLLG